MTSQQADFQPYPDELMKIGEVMAKLQSAFDFTSFNDTNKAILDIAAHEEFAKIGIEVRVNWQEIMKKSPLAIAGVVPTGVWMPGIEPIGRTRDESETDHDRVAWGVTHGLMDGQAGYIRADGTKHEEPIKRIIH